AWTERWCASRRLSTARSRPPTNGCGGSSPWRFRRSPGSYRTERLAEAISRRRRRELNERRLQFGRDGYLQYELAADRGGELLRAFDGQNKRTRTADHTVFVVAIEPDEAPRRAD